MIHQIEARFSFSPTTLFEVSVGLFDSCFP